MPFIRRGWAHFSIKLDFVDTLLWIRAMGAVSSSYLVETEGERKKNYGTLAEIGLIV